MSLADRTERRFFLKLGYSENALKKAYLEQLKSQGFKVVKFPILPTGVMV